MKTITISTNLIELNQGQLDGLPPNPRQVIPEKLDNLKKSIIESPEMLKLREPIVYPLDNGHFIAIGGNMRIRACQELGIESLICKVLPKDTTVEKLREYTIKDNNATGKDDWAVLTSEWNIDEVASWGLEADDSWCTDKSLPESPLVVSNKPKAKGLNWGNPNQESRCDMSPRLAVHEKNGTFFITSFKKSNEGTPLSAIKQNPDNVRIFADEAIRVIHGIIGLHQIKDIALISAPKRRHKKTNFAEQVCMDISKQTGIRFYPNAIKSHNRDRLHPIFTLETCIMEPFVILYDDIVTTGSTIKHSLNLLEDKNILVIISINNH